MSGTTPILLDVWGSRSWALRLERLNERQIRALLDLRMTYQKDSTDRVPFRLKELQERKRKTSFEPDGVPLQNDSSGVEATQLCKKISSNTAKKRRASAEPISEKLPGESSSPGKRKYLQSQCEISAEQRARIVSEMLEEKITLGDIAKKFNRSVDTIRGWVREAAGHQLPKRERFPFF